MQHGAAQCGLHALALGKAGRAPVRNGLQAEGGKHLAHPLGARRGARQEDRHHHGHHDRQQDLHDVGQKRRQIADGHRSFAHQSSAEPHDRHRGKVQNDHHHRQHHGECPIHTERCTGQGFVRPVEPFAFKVATHEGSNDPHAGDLLSHHLVQAVDLYLHGAKLRDDLDHHDAQEGAHDRNGDEQQRGELGPLV